MPPLKEFIFQDVENDRINISIKAYGKNHAIEIIKKITKEPNSFKLL